MSNQDTQGGDHGALERELAAALRERADAIHPTDRWSEIGAATRSTQPSPRRWPGILLAAAAVTAVVGGERAFEERVAAYWMALALARIDGSSPVEYLTDEARTELREDLMGLVAAPRATLADLDHLWRIQP